MTGRLAPGAGEVPSAVDVPGAGDNAPVVAGDIAAPGAAGALAAPGAVGAPGGGGI